MAKYRKKPVVVEALRIEPDGTNVAEAAEWSGGRHDYSGVVVETLNGPVRAGLGDWIIRGVQGEHYPCDPGVFAATHELVVEREPTNIGHCGSVSG